MMQQHLGDLASLYALDALEGDELAGFESHLVRCDACVTEVDHYQAVTSQLVTDQPADEQLWDRIATSLNGDHEIPSGQPTESVDLDARSPRRLTMLSWISAVAAVAAIVFAGIALAQRSLLNDLLGDSAVSAAAEQAASNPDAYVGDFIVEGKPVAHVVLTPEGDGFVLPTEYLEPLESDRTYQLWVITSDEQVISGGVLGNDPASSTFTWTGDVKGFALTREAAAGVTISEGDLVAVATEA